MLGRGLPQDSQVQLTAPDWNKIATKMAHATGNMFNQILPLALLVAIAVGNGEWGYLYKTSNTLNITGGGKIHTTSKRWK